jgi:hypothetical protein
VLRLLLGMIVSLVPKSYRSGWDWATSADFRRATILSGILEAVLCVGIYAARYIYFLQYRIGTIADAVMKRGGGEELLASEAAQFAMGFTTLAEYGHQVRPRHRLLPAQGVGPPADHRV